MRSLTGLIEPTKGEVLYDGRNFVNMSKKEQILMRREMGMIFKVLHSSIRSPYWKMYVFHWICSQI